MQVFTDMEGRRWELSVNAWTMTQVLDGTGVLLTSIVDDGCKLYATLHDDPLLLVSVVWWIIKDQAERQDVDQKSFAMAMAGPCILNAREALIDEIVNFSPNQAQRENLEMIRTKATETAALIQAETAKHLAKMDPTETARNVTSLFLNTPESPGSIRGNTH